MLTRMVSISWPRDPPASASQSAGITGVSHCARLLSFYIRIYYSYFSKLAFYFRISMTYNWKIGKISHNVMMRTNITLSIFFLFFETEFHSCCPGWSAMAQSWFTATSTSHGVRSSRPDWPTWWNPVSIKNTKISWEWWQTPVIPAIQEPEAGESLEPGRQLSEIVPMHSSLGDRARLCLKKKNLKSWILFYL